MDTEIREFIESNRRALKEAEERITKFVHENKEVFTNDVIYASQLQAILNEVFFGEVPRESDFQDLYGYKFDI